MGDVGQEGAAALPAGDPAAAHDVVTTAGAVLPEHLSPWSMFLSADPVVQVVMMGLALASLLTWTIWLAKSLEIARARRRLRAALDAVSAAPTLKDASAHLGSRTAPDALLLSASLAEMRASQDLPPEGLKERIGLRLERLEAGIARRIGVGLGLLATIGATAPFVGLFGTVWGIMNSFIGISKAHTTNLAVVAPGIAEALLATGLGLVAAIPAVVIYNFFARAIAAYRGELADLSAEVLRHVSRDLDRAQGRRVRAAE